MLEWRSVVVERQGQSRQPAPGRPCKTPMRPRSRTTPWLLDDVRDALVSLGERRNPKKDRRLQLRLLFGV